MKQLLAACVVFLGLGGVAAAGPYEDGMAARARGDYAAAARLLRQAAEGGHANAQYNLGLLYEDGQGVALDHVQAHKWFDLSAGRTTDMVLRLAAEAGRNGAADHMTPDQIAEAKRLAQEWRPSGR